MLITKSSGLNTVPMKHSIEAILQPKDRSIEAILQRDDEDQTNAVLTLIKKNEKNGITKKEMQDKLNSKFDYYFT